MTFKVLVDDNFHYMEEDERSVLGEFDTAEAAISAAKKVVDDYLRREYRPGMTAEALHERYTSFGDDPFISGGEVDFSAWAYAKARCEVICAGG
jgi:hypothetical protein